MTLYDLYTMYMRHKTTPKMYKSYGTYGIFLYKRHGVLHSIKTKAARILELCADNPHGMSYSRVPKINIDDTDIIHTEEGERILTDGMKILQVSDVVVTLNDEMSDENFAINIKKFIKMYGYGETCEL